MPTDYNEILRARPLQLIKNFSVAPPDDVGGYKGRRVATLTTGRGQDGSRIDTSTRGGAIAYSRVERAHKVVWLSLSKVAQGGYQVTGNEGGDRIRFDVSPVRRGGWVPVYWLPWDTAGAAIRLTIPPGDRSDGSPDLFFTAAINGCSVFFQGSPQNPTIYHCGGATGQGVDAQAGAEFWQEVVADFALLDANRGKQKGALHHTEVNKTHYISTPGFGEGQYNQPLQPGQGTTTPQALAYQRWLTGNSPSSFRIEQVNPWGCVMGIRRGTDWTFYLQENATVVYHELRKKIFGRNRRTETRSIARPMIVSEIFPGGRCVYRAHAPVPRVT